MNQQRPSSGNFEQFKGGSSNVLSSGTRTQSVIMGGLGSPMGQSPMPPPVPSRVATSTSSNQSYGVTSGLGGGYGIGAGLNYTGFGMGGGYGGYGGYTGYGGYGGYERYRNLYSGIHSPGWSGQLGNPSRDVETRFVQFAEESSRPAFQSIESIVNTFSSVAFMLESTLFAMTSSFRAILSVAENVGRAKNMLSELVNAFALVRFVKWLYRKIAHTLGIDPDDPNAEQVWRKTAVEVINGDNRGPATWPILVFISALIAIPYIVNKLVSNVRQRVTVNDNNPKDWFRYDEPVYSAVAIYDFAAVTNEEMSVKAGQKIWLAPQSLQINNLPGWSKATDSVNVGLVPSNYLKIIGQLKRKSESTDAAHVNSDGTAGTTSCNDNIDVMQESEASSERAQVSNDSNEHLFE